MISGNGDPCPMPSWKKRKNGESDKKEGRNRCEGGSGRVRKGGRERKLEKR